VIAVIIGSFTSITAPSYAQDPTPTPLVATVPENVCENAPALQLRLGQQAKVVASNDPNLPGAQMKAQPDFTLGVGRYLPVDTVVTVADGPTCDDQQNQWWKVRVGQLEGWVTETFGSTYILEPLEGDATVTLATTIMVPLACIAPNDPNDPPTPDVPMLRVIYVKPDGSVIASDNGDTGGRQLARFEPPPTNVDLAPDASAVIVTNRNGIYWVNAKSGETVMLADGASLGLAPVSWPNRALWEPDGRGLAIEVEDRSTGVVSYGIYRFPVDGKDSLFRVDTGAQPPNSIRRSPTSDKMVVLSANDVIPFPNSSEDDADPLITYTPISEVEEASGIYSPAITWSSDGAGFYTYIPAGQFTAPDDPIANHLWFVPLDGEPKDLGIPPNVAQGEYVIPSPDGLKLMLGRGATWRLQDVATGNLLATVPPIEYLFDWTPDSKGAIYTSPNSIASFIGIDGNTTSSYLPTGIQNLYGIRWLADGTLLYLVEKVEGYQIGIQQPGQQPVILGDITGTDAFSGAVLPGVPADAKTPKRCG
jgi:hypothetical protein